MLALLALPGAGATAAAPATDDGQEPSSHQIEQWINQLGSLDFEARERAYKALAAAGEEAREALYRALRSDDAEVRWNATRLLNELDHERTGRPPRLERLAPADDERELRRGPRLELGIEDLMRSLEQRFGGGALGPLGAGGPGELDRMMRRLEALLERTGPGSLHTRVQPGRSTDLQVRRSENGQDSLLRLQVSEDGKARLEIERDGETTVVEADSIEALHEEHGDLLAEFGLDGLDRQPAWRPAPPAPPGGRLVPLREEPRARLGVLVTAVPEALSAHLDLDPGEGLLVEEVQPDTLASRLGLVRFDVLVAIEGEPITSAEVIAGVLERIDLEQGLELRVIRKGEEHALRLPD